MRPNAVAEAASETMVTFTLP